jgi:hypothetical protein
MILQAPFKNRNGDAQQTSIDTSPSVEAPPSFRSLLERRVVPRPARPGHESAHRLFQTHGGPCKESREALGGRDSASITVHEIRAKWREAGTTYKLCTVAGMIAEGDTWSEVPPVGFIVCDDRVRILLALDSAVRIPSHK